MMLEDLDLSSRLTVGDSSESVRSNSTKFIKEITNIVSYQYEESNTSANLKLDIMFAARVTIKIIEQWCKRRKKNYSYNNISYQFTIQ